MMAYGYIVFLGTLTLKKYLYEYFKFSSNFAKYDYSINLPLRILKVNLTLLELMTLLLCCYFAFLYVQTKFWIANNVFAICFTVYAIENWLVGSFRNILVIFIGLIIYDFSFVFGTDIMVTVAQEFDLPIKLVFPLTWRMANFSMIGLGDIIIPGLLCSMCARIDLITTFNNAREKAIKTGAKD
jgi:minor histocompatibility antigen H13